MAGPQTHTGGAPTVVLRRSLAGAGVGRSPGGHITARTASGGAIQELTVSAGALGLCPEELTAEIEAAVGAAHHDYARRADGRG